MNLFIRRQKLVQNFKNSCLATDWQIICQAEKHAHRTLSCFVRVCCTDMRVRAFESPDPELCFKYPHHGCWMPRKFFYGPVKVEDSLFFDLVHSVEQNLKIFRSPKNWILVVKMTWNKKLIIQLLQVFWDLKKVEKIPNIILSCSKHLRNI